jgi:hypothetical protein
MQRGMPVALAAALIAVVAAALPAGAATVHLYGGQGFEKAVEGVKPGDTVIVHKGTYADTGRISITVKGTAASPVVIRAAAGEPRPLITRPAGSTAQNTINIEGASHVTIKGLELSGNGDGINMSKQPHHITLEDLEIHDIDVGVNFRSDMHHITVRRCQIYNTAGTGEGMYVGCNYATCAVSDSLIEGNWIYNTKNASQGDGIEIKRGSYNNVVRDNVIYNTKYPCILLYGTEGKAVNVVERNVMWSCGDSGIQVAADAVIRNNIILQSPANGLNSQPHQGVNPKNLQFVHNTIVGGNPCLRMSSWGGASGMVFANNAVYCPSGSYKLQSLAGVAIKGNVIAPKPPATMPASGYTLGGAVTADLASAAQRDVYPKAGSKLIDAGDPTHVVKDDFNGTLRTGKPEAGAYTYTTASNPGWKVAPGFKSKTTTPPADGGVPKADAGTGTDGATTADAQADDAKVSGEAGTSADQGSTAGDGTPPPGASPDDGCGCRLSAPPSAHGLLVLGLLVMLLRMRHPRGR